MKVATVKDHFINPTAAATDFFWIVVPLMFAANTILIYNEWKTKMRWVSILAFLCLVAASYVGQELIIPINEIIATGTIGAKELSIMLKDWMFYNDIRWLIMTMMWLIMMFYFYAKGSLMTVIED
jgi:hypothetical protein